MKIIAAAQMQNLKSIDEITFETGFWTDGKSVFHRYKKLNARLADFKIFGGADGVFASDGKSCFCGEVRLRGADAASFRALNFSVFAADKNKIYTITGRVKDADAASFRALDDGRALLFHGYGADKNCVFYHDYEGKAKMLKTADTASFESLGDGYFAKDGARIYGYGKIIKGADVRSWRKISPADGYYSADEKRVFYGFRQILGADANSFLAVAPKNASKTEFNLAKDRKNFYLNGEIISEAEFKNFQNRWQELSGKPLIWD